MSLAFFDKNFYSILQEFWRKVELLSKIKININLLEDMCYSQYGYAMGAGNVFTSYYCQKLEGKHCRRPIPIMGFVDVFGPCLIGETRWLQNSEWKSRQLRLLFTFVSVNLKWTLNNYYENDYVHSTLFNITTRT